MAIGLNGILNQRIEAYPLNANGDKVSVKTTNDRHYADTKEPLSPDYVVENFSQALKNAISSVNAQQVKADELSQKIVSDPKSVEPHEVMIAAEKARVSLQFTKTIADGVVRAYRELTTMR